MPNNKHNYEYICNFFTQNGCKLLSNEYKNAHSVLKYQCRCGKIATTTYHRAYCQNCRCKSCGIESRAKTQAYCINDVKDIFAKKDCELLSPIYKNAKKHIEYKCPNGHVSTTTLTSFLQNHGCKKCANLKISGSNHYLWRADREQFKKDRDLYHRCCRVLLRFKKSTSGIMGANAKVFGYKSSDLRKHISSHPNFKKCKNIKWDIDHIFPVKAFCDFGITDLKLINSLDNLQPLSHNLNNKKGDKYNIDLFVAWLKKKGHSGQRTDVKINYLQLRSKK